jgi:hypothetical protein
LYLATASSGVAAEPLWKYGGCCHTPFKGAVLNCFDALLDADVQVTFAGNGAAGVSVAVRIAAS